ncbi:MAG: hypothetical protein K6T35_13760, partial [Meiothermus silvanus]|nr:hypothetical protein [Allomeiothermus silvanus]
MKALPINLPLSASARARRILQGLFEEAQYGVPFLNSTLFEALLSEREGRKAERLVIEALRQPALANRFRTLPLPPRVAHRSGGRAQRESTNPPIQGGRMDHKRIEERRIDDPIALRDCLSRLSDIGNLSVAQARL